MNKLKTVKKILTSSCIYFTVALFGIFLGAKMSNVAASFLSFGPAAIVYLACLIMAALNRVWKLEYSVGVRLLIHFIGSLITFALLFIIVPGKAVYTNLAQVVIRAGLFAILYFVIALIALIIASIRKNRRSDDLEYEPQFGNFFDK